MSIERRVRDRRMAEANDYIAGIVTARSGRDRRSDQQLCRDNNFVNNWMLQFQSARERRK